MILVTLKKLKLKKKMKKKMKISINKMKILEIN